jgi:hypothetical protein
MERWRALGDVALVLLLLASLWLGVYFMQGGR